MWDKLHDVRVTKNAKEEKYVYLVKCNTCGFEARVMTLQEADITKNSHVNFKKLVGQ